ncbi:MAG: chromate transporter [Kurthia sp.]|nr:chromate transporter [Candidatus Kurthia equi]
MKQRQIFIAFFRSGLLGFGGGPSVIPLLEKEVVKNFRMLSSEDFTNALAVANTLPGPIATKMAGYIGYRVGGLLGMCNALLATVLPTVIAVILFLETLQRFQEYPFVQGMTKGVILVVCAMMISLMVDFLKKSQKKLGWVLAIVLLLVSGIAMLVFNLHPGFVIATLLLLAFFAPIRGGKAS